MAYEWTREYCLLKKGTVSDFKEEWQATRYMLDGKMYAMQGGDKYGKPILTIKLEPAHGEYLRGAYKDIIPGYYMNKQHWNSLYLEGDVPDETVRQMLDEAYGLVLQGLSRKAREALLSDARN